MTGIIIPVIYYTLIIYTYRRGWYNYTTPSVGRGWDSTNIGLCPAGHNPMDLSLFLKIEENIFIPPRPIEE